MASNKSGRKTGNHAQPAVEEGGTAAQPNEAAGKKPPRPSQCRNFARDALAESLPKIVDAFVDKAKEGSVSHFNLLTKFGGFDYRPVPAPAKRRGKSFAHRLLDNMKEHEAKMIAARDAAERKSGK